MSAGQLPRCSLLALCVPHRRKSRLITFEEYHPNGTRYESPQAPIAPGFFPFNRCDVFACGHCGCAVLKYTEYGGYYVDHRVRRVDPDLVVDR